MDLSGMFMFALTSLCYMCRRGGDGTDLLFIPFSDDTLEHILADMEAVE